MKRFIILYVLFLIALFAIFYAPSSTLSYNINHMQTELTLYILEFFLQKNQLQGNDIWINPHYKIVITHTCNGIIPSLFYGQQFGLTPQHSYVKDFGVL